MKICRDGNCEKTDHCCCYCSEECEQRCEDGQYGGNPEGCEGAEEETTMTDHEKEDAILRYITMAHEHVVRVTDNTYTSPGEAQAALTAVEEAKRQVMGLLGRETV